MFCLLFSGHFTQVLLLKSFSQEEKSHNQTFCNAVNNVSGNRCESDCRSSGREFDPGLVPYFCGDWSWNNFYGHSPPFRWIIQVGLLSVTSESMCTKYWLIACSSLPRKKLIRWTDRPAMTIAVYLGRKATKQSKTCVKRPLSKRLKIVFQNQLSLNAGQKYCTMLQREHSAILPPSLSYQLLFRSLFCLLLNGRFTQVLL